MMCDTAGSIVSQSQRQPASSGGWFGFIRSAIVAGFEAYGLAQIGLPPIGMPVVNPATDVKDGAAPVAARKPICSQPVAKAQMEAVRSVRVCTGKPAMNPA